MRRQAIEQGISLNDAVQRLLRQAAGLEEGSSRRRNLRDLAGSWSQEDVSAFAATQQGFDSIDPEMWQ